MTNGLIASLLPFPVLPPVIRDLFQTAGLGMVDGQSFEASPSVASCGSLNCFFSPSVCVSLSPLLLLLLQTMLIVVGGVAALLGVVGGVYYYRVKRTRSSPRAGSSEVPDDYYRLLN